MSSGSHTLPASPRLTESQQAEANLLLDGPVDPTALEIIPNPISSTDHQQRQSNAFEEWATLPWYRRPSAAW